MLGPDGVIRLVNDAWHLFGRENGLKDLAKICPGNNYLKVCRRAAMAGDESARQALEGIEAVMRGELPDYLLEYPCHSPDKKRWFLMKVAPVSRDGCVLITHVDITQRKAAEDALRESVEHYWALYDDNPTMYFTLDTRGTVLSVNRFGAEQLGYTPEELVGHSVLNVFYPDDKEAVRRRLELYLEDPTQIVQWEFRKVRKDGSMLWVKEVVRAVTRADGKTVILVVCDDITDRKRIEQELRAKSEKLELSNKELQDFAFIASHDLQEPLRKLQTFGTMLMEKWSGQFDKSARGILERMILATKRMSDMIQSLLDYSRVTTSTGEFQRIDLTRVIREVINDLEIPIENSGARVEVEELPEIDADRAQMQRLFQNLIGNALKFRGEQPPLVRIKAEPTNGAEIFPNGERAVRVRILVEDNGIGFDEIHLEKIFTPFKRLHSRNEYEGTGIGLTICRKIVERHGGSITAKSRPGEGSTFVITLPLKQVKTEGT